MKILWWIGLPVRLLMAGTVIVFAALILPDDLDDIKWDMQNFIRAGK